MAFPSVSYTFANGTAADATQVNQNFTDLINGLSDGTKALNINAFTAAGTATLNGAVVLGDSTVDDITIGGSIAATIPVKTTNSFDIGSTTFSFRSIYLSDAGSAARATRLLGATIGSSYTFTFPTTGGTSAYNLRTNGSGVTSWQVPTLGGLMNIGIAASVGSGAMGVSLKGADGNDASSTNPIDIVFRSATATTGTPVIRSVTGALSVTVSSGSTLGSTSAAANWAYLYAIDNAGTVELAISGSKVFDEGTLQSTTAEGGAGAADSKNVLYSTTARSNVAIRLLGRIKSTQATAGNWATSPSEITLYTFEKNVPRSQISLEIGNGHGGSVSGETKVRNYTTVNLSTGSLLTYVPRDSTHGDRVLVNNDCVVTVEAWDLQQAGNPFIGIVVNGTALSTAIATTVPARLTYAQGARAITKQQTAGLLPFGVIWTGFVAAGDLLYIQTDGNVDASADLAKANFCAVSI